MARRHAMPAQVGKRRLQPARHCNKGLQPIAFPVQIAPLADAFLRATAPSSPRRGSTLSVCIAAPVTDLEFPSGIEAAACYNIFQQ